MYISNKLFLFLFVNLVFILVPGCSCDNDNMENAPVVQLHFNLNAIEMEEVDAVSTKSKNESCNVTLGGIYNNSTTRFTGVLDETTIKSISVFQFDGTTADAILVKKEYYALSSTSNIITTLIESASTQTVYIVANIGDITSNYFTGDGATTLSSFRNSYFNFNTESLSSESLLPMIGVYVGATKPNVYNIIMERMVAKVNFTCKTELSDASESFIIKSVRLYSVSNKVLMATPNQTAVNDDSHIDCNLISSYPENTNLTWYIPENIRGSVETILLPVNKGEKSAPVNSTYIEIEGVYQLASGAKEYIRYRIYLGTNLTTNFDVLRNKIYKLSVIIKGMNDLDSRIIVPQNLSVNNTKTLSTANCYVVNANNHLYKFNATIMGNGKVTPAAIIKNSNSDIIQAAPEIKPLTLAPASAFVIWETGNKGDVIEDGSLQVLDGYVLFKTADNLKNGNALIGIKDTEGNTLWSWHIWKTNYNPETDYVVHDTRKIDSLNYPDYNHSYARVFRMMKYNLGTIATDNATDNAGDLGLFYQWGRKDPFVGAAGWINGGSRIETFNATGSEWLDGRTGGNAIQRETTGSGASATIAYSIQHPTHFIYAPQSDGGITYDWLNVTAYADQRDNLWGNPNYTAKVPNTASGSKSIYDPCPPGWRVPLQDSFTRFTLSGLNTNSLTEYNVYQSDFDKGWLFYSTGDAYGSYFYWGACGSLSWNLGTLLDVNTSGHCWTSSPYTCNSVAGGLLSFADTYVHPLNNASRAFGMNVRCVKEW